jgi:hypothetical protein
VQIIQIGMAVAMTRTQKYPAERRIWRGLMRSYATSTAQPANA